jgi:hypothetical protein
MLFQQSRMKQTATVTLCTIRATTGQLADLVTA